MCIRDRLDGGKIVAVGKEVNAPADAQVIDAAGCIVAPGLVDGHCHIGLEEAAIQFEGTDGNECTDPVTPQERAIDAIQPMDETIAQAAAAGVTTAVTGPGSGNVVGGTFVAVKMHGKRVDDMILKYPVAMKCAFGENPKRVYGTQKKMPMTRMGTSALLRDLLARTVEYDQAWKDYKADPKNNKKPAIDVKLEAMLPVIHKEIPLKAHAHRADDIFTALRIAKEFDVDITLDHCTEGHLIADELVKEGKGCLVGPTLGDKSKFELENKSFDCLLYTSQADVAVAFHKARSHDAAGGVDDLCIGGSIHFLAHSGDLVAIQQHLAVFDILAGHCFNQTIFNKNHGKHPPFQSYYLIAYLFPGKLSKKSPLFGCQIPRLLFMQFAKKLLYLYSLPLR